MSETSSFRNSDYLGTRHEPRHRVRCAIHGFIVYSDAERSIIDNPLFRRLRYIRQLALTELVYPGATHTRFEHSLGVMEMASRIFDRLASREGARMEDIFAEIPELKERTMARARQVCRLAGLLHDVGHCCFSHAAEKVLHKNSGHESLSIRIITSPEFLGSEIDREFFPGCSNLVASLISEPAPQLQILADIVSGQIDADRTDYLLRDSHHCGVDYGRFDYRRLIECLTVWQEQPGRPLEIAIQRDGIHSFESLILARYQMNTQVYYHRLRRIYDLYLEKYFQEVQRDNPDRFDSPSKVLELNDFRAMVELMGAAHDPSATGHQWARRIIHRQHHRDVFALDEKDGPLVLRKAGIVQKQIREEFSEIEFLEDFPEKMVSIHKIARPSDEADGRIDFPLIDRGRRSSLGERSQLLERLPGAFRVGYIFADVSDRELRVKIANRCREIYHTC